MNVESGKSLPDLGKWKFTIKPILYG